MGHRASMSGIALLCAAVMLAACDGKPSPEVNSASIMASANPAAAVHDQVKRGEYLVTIMGCHDCHTPFRMGANGPEPDMTRALSGHPEAVGKMPPSPPLTGPWVWAGSGTNTAFAGPWGVSYAVNLTPDPQTGIGIWNEKMFVQAMRTGRHLGAGRPIMPPMPWPAYRHATDEDLKAMFTYLRSMPPLKNKAPDYEPPPQVASK